MLLAYRLVKQFSAKYFVKGLFGTQAAANEWLPKNRQGFKKEKHLTK
jgi:hypothetical protein